jgi:hypothetical protein
VSLFGPYIFLKLFLSHILSASSTCSDIVHPSQPYIPLAWSLFYIFSVWHYLISRVSSLFWSIHDNSTLKITKPYIRTSHTTYCVSV